ncbi:potassium channel family protein [Microbacterium halophytorum]|uniref:potassium channel family protein n=1 Tax=Microbacterium halophytorum TaxID=2067568 RepID=UPI000CFC8DC7|nr:potassium channel family protein [Microbacterium halophytorum]
MYGTRYERWVSRTKWPLMAASLLFLAAFAVGTLTPPDSPLQGVADAIIWATWVVFVVDYAVRLSVAAPRGRWFAGHLLDLVIVVLPMLRLLLLLRFATAVAIVGRNAGNALRGRVALYTGGTALLVMFVAALAILNAEEGHGGAIESFGEALWWTLVTLTTVGYGDYTPITTAGRLIAAALMIGGIALIGSATATITSWIVEKLSARDDEEDADDARQVAALRVEIAELKAMLRERGAE